MIKSGADELLDLKRAEDDKDDEGGLADSTHTIATAEITKHLSKSRGFGDGVSPRRLPGNGHRHSSQVTLLRVLLCLCQDTRLLLAFVYPELAHVCYEVMGDDNDNYYKRRDGI